jgi:acyl-coenzyme A thioesterase PaaI-like protein
VPYLRLKTGAGDLRSGGTVAGPLVFGFADLAMEAAVMSVLGKMTFAVTTDVTIPFRFPPKAPTMPPSCTQS